MNAHTGHPWGIDARLRYELVVDDATPSNNVIKDMHFQAYKTYRKSFRAKVEESLKGAKVLDPLVKSAIVVERVSAGALDWDNALGGIKPLLDCLVSRSEKNPDGLGLIVDDNPVNMPVAPFLRQVKGKRGAKKTILRVFELSGKDTEPDVPWGSEIVSSISFTLEGATPSNNVIKNMHYQAYKTLRKSWKTKLLKELGWTKPVKTFARSAVRVDRYCSGYLDWDNAFGGLKPLLDCLVSPSKRNPDGLGLIHDDNPKSMPYPPLMTQIKESRKNTRTVVTIYELT